MKIKYLSLIFLILISGCVMKADIPEKDKNKLMQCIDYRDGEIFRFNTSNIKAFINFNGDPEIVFLDESQIKRVITSNNESYFKCKEISK